MRGTCDDCAARFEPGEPALGLRRALAQAIELEIAAFFALQAIDPKC